MTAIKPLYIRVSDSQNIFGIHPSTIYRLAHRGEITIHKRGGSSFLRISEIEQWIEGRDDEDGHRQGEKKEPIRDTHAFHS